MRTKKNAGFLIILCALIVISPLPVAAETDADVYGTIQRMTRAMNQFSDSMEADPGLDAMSEAVEKLAETIENIGKEMVSIYQENQSLFQAPPAEAEQIIAEHQDTLMRYEEALQKAVRFANDNMDKEDFQTSFERLNTAIYEMYR
ncbi:MAG: hypothetical protein ACOCYA_03305 [Spirochaetota bacterium]